MGKQKPEFESDYRKSNPALHLLYVKWAVKHLREFDRSIRRFERFSSINMMDVEVALHRERARLVKTNAAYADADEILQSISGKKRG